MLSFLPQPHSLLLPKCFILSSRCPECFWRLLNPVRDLEACLVHSRLSHLPGPRDWYQEQAEHPSQQVKWDHAAGHPPVLASTDSLGLLQPNNLPEAGTTSNTPAFVSQLCAKKSPIPPHRKERQHESRLEAGRAFWKLRFQFSHC